MARDKEAVVWTRLSGKAEKMGRLYLTESECRFTYELDYLTLDQPGLGLLYPPQIVQDTTIVRQRSEFFDFLPPIQSLIPPKGEHNFQRKLVLSYLAKKDIRPAPGLETDWELLKVAGHGAIGHIDVFENDEKALQWYSSSQDTELFEVTEDLGFSLKEMLRWLDQDADEIINIIGPTPSVGGAIPKILLSIADSGWDNRIGLPSRGAVPNLTDVVVKFEQNTAYPGINELEALSLDIHQEAGFEVPRYWLSDMRGIPVLAVERFDRDAANTPLFNETLYSVLATGDARLTHHHSYTYDAVGKAIDRSPIDILSQRKQGKQALYKRLILSFLTGNGDLHLENLSICLQNNEAKFTPVYDPTPMRAYSLHNMLAVMPFGDYGQIIDSSAEPVSLQQGLKRLAKNLGITPSQQHQILTECLAVTEGYDSRVNSLSSLHKDNKSNLIACVAKVRHKLKNLL